MQHLFKNTAAAIIGLALTATVLPAETFHHDRDRGDRFEQTNWHADRDRDHREQQRERQRERDRERERDAHRFEYRDFRR